MGDEGEGDVGMVGDGGESTSISSASSSISMSMDTGCVVGGIPCPCDMGGGRGIGSKPCKRKLFHRRRESPMSCCFRFDRRGEEEGQDGERVGVESGEGDDEREGHWLGEVGGEGDGNSR